ncbi:MAG: hypothetical protein WCE53_10165 [Candidatus Acidiferrum sp.]
MKNANPQSPLALSVSGRIFIMGGAGLLILVGLVLQLGALGYGHAQPGNIWIASTIVGSVWSMLISQLDAPWAQELATFWPLLLISIGLAILLVTRREPNQPVLSRSRGGQNHGQ